MKIKDKRMEVGISRKTACERMLIPYRTWQDWETGNRQPTEWAERFVINELNQIEKEMESMKTMELKKAILNELDLLWDCENTEEILDRMAELESDGSLTMNTIKVDGYDREVAWYEDMDDNDRRGIAYMEDDNIKVITDRYNPSEYAEIMEQFEG